MTITKNHIVDQIINRVGFSQKKSSEVVEQLLDVLKRAMESGEDVLISNFGKFKISEKSERKGRNPATCDEMMLSARRVVTFKASTTLRDKINATQNSRKKNNAGL